MREISKTRLIDFGLLCVNDKGEYLVLNDVRMAEIRLASLVYLLVYVSTYCVAIALLRQNKPFPLLYLGLPSPCTASLQALSVNAISVTYPRQKAGRRLDNLGVHMREHFCIFEKFPCSNL